MESPYKSPEARLDVPGSLVNSSGSGKDAVLPDGISGWSWGAFFLNWIWAAFNRTYIGLLALVPYVGFIMAIVLGVKGREWAWKNKRWESVEHFNAVQRRWSFWGVVLTLGIAGLGIVVAIMVPALVGATQTQ
jgi:hypothetical protein